MTLGALDGYLHTFSSYKAWKDEFGGKEGQRDIIDVLWETVIDAVEPWKARIGGGQAGLSHAQAWAMQELFVSMPPWACMLLCLHF